MKKPLENIIIGILHKAGIKERPENFESIYDFIADDLSDYQNNDYSEADVADSLKRFIEQIR